ncbi:hypothetical protein GOBAR_AA33223 [Gossypium barbadense]|uniref:C2 NT-type domain-containing protein n=1 Tax=Gossypium barbadense TaxID=3634 RepID=A0A2P5W8N3_GOSBA|nr:hypothetical protein GOBAR_AA33223 [Gossypium barbadense]
MVLGLRTKNRTGNSYQVHYIVCVKEINPWTPLQPLPAAQSLLLQWENGDKSSGSLVSSFRNGKIEFGESFRLQRNCSEFYLYEPRKDNMAKGQRLGSAVANLADYGTIRETISISTPINLKKSSSNIEQPVLYLNIQPFDKDLSPKHSSSKVGHDLTTLIGERYNNPIQTNYDIRDLPAQPVRGETINSAPPNLMPRHSKRISSHLVGPK